jgi:hypothetical protein
MTETELREAAQGQLREQGLVVSRDGAALVDPKGTA